MSAQPSPSERYLPTLSEPVRRWLRFLGVLVAIILGVLVMLRLQSVFTPMLVALAIAYILNPLVTWLERHGMRRLFTVTVMYILGTLVFVSVSVWLGSTIITQAVELPARIGRYAERLGRFATEVQARLEQLGAEHLPHIPWIAPDTMPAPTEGATTAPAEPAPDSAPSTQPQPAQSTPWGPRVAVFIRQNAATIAGSAATSVARLFGDLVTLATLFVLIPMYTFFFLWRFNYIVTTVRDHLPGKYRPTIVHVVGTVDQAVANFFRGRLIVCMIIAMLNGIGWQIVGVRFGLVLGILAGLFNLVPYLCSLVVPVALIMAYVSASEAGVGWFGPVVLTAGVFMTVQAIEAFVLSPLIESRSNSLHPITTVVALLIGGELAGILGMLLSIPVASTLKTLAAEFVLPEVRRLAAEPPPAPPPGTAPAAHGPPPTAKKRKNPDQAADAD